MKSSVDFIFFFNLVRDLFRMNLIKNNVIWATHGTEWLPLLFTPNLTFGLASDLVSSYTRKGCFPFKFWIFCLLSRLSPSSFLRLLCPSPALGKPPNLTPYRRSPIQHTAMETNGGNPQIPPICLLRQQHCAGGFNQSSLPTIDIVFGNHIRRKLLQVLLWHETLKRTNVQGKKHR